jgi:hypothetical protein
MINAVNLNPEKNSTSGLLLLLSGFIGGKDEQDNE